MLESEEIDEDYFTPVPSASLASLFGNESQNVNTVQNETLRYTPPKQNTNQKTDEAKVSQCIFACALIVYEWCNNVYTSKGKLGFAIMKILQNNSYTIVLYDSNKVTISSTVVSPKFEVTLNDQNYLSYYDSNQKYWSVYAPEVETKKIIDLLKSFKVTIKHSSQSDTGPPEHVQIMSFPKLMNHKENELRDVGSDTDSSLNGKRKITILNRMATVGHSVLPPKSNIVEKSSDSSDSNDNNEIIKFHKIRHKPTKSVMKKNTIENTIYEQNLIETPKKITLSKPQQSVEDITSVNTFINSQLIPVTATNIISSPNNNRIGNDLGHFISEQRINSSELRINMNRITDKVDHLLHKISHLEHSTKSDIETNFQNEILLKLLREYEGKIKRYEELFKSQTSDISLDFPMISKDTGHYNENVILKRKLEEIEAVLKLKNIEITKLQEEIRLLKTAYSEEIDRKNELNSKILDLEKKNISKDEASVLGKQNDYNSAVNSSETSDTIKKIMNHIYRAVSVNFENEEMYGGENVKNVIALIIKKVTIDSLNNLKI